MNELEYEELTTLKKELETAINNEDWFDADDLLDILWEKIRDWYWHENHPTHVYVADVYSTAVHKAIEEKQGAQADNNRECFTRDWVCPYCGDELDVEYIQEERYLVKCGCRPLRKPWWGIELPHVSQRFKKDAEEEYDAITLGIATAYQNTTSTDDKDYCND